MSAALAPPFIVASLLLCVAGVLKLRSPRGAAAALAALGLPAGVWVVRALAACEVALGAVCAFHPSAIAAAALAGVYAVFAVVARLLTRRRSGCGCFGEDDSPASGLHSIASAVLGCVAIGVAAFGASPLGLDRLLDRSPATTAVLLIGTAGGLYGITLVYTVVPRAWRAWGSE